MLQRRNHMRVKVSLLLPELIAHLAQLQLKHLDPLPQLVLAITEAVRKHMSLESGVVFDCPLLHCQLQLVDFVCMILFDRLNLCSIELVARRTGL